MGSQCRSNPLLGDKMDADEVLTGKKNKQPVESNHTDALYSHMGKPVSKEILESVFKKKTLLPELNPKPFIKIVDVKGKDRKVRHGIEVGFELSSFSTHSHLKLKIFLL